MPVSAVCFVRTGPNSSDYRGVTNTSTKVEGDDGKYFMDTFEGYLKETLQEGRPFLAGLWQFQHIQIHVSMFFVPSIIV